MNFIVEESASLKSGAGRFQVAYLDADTLLPLDIEIFDFDESTSRWAKASSMQETFGLSDLSPRRFLDYANELLFNGSSPSSAASTNSGHQCPSNNC